MICDQCGKTMNVKFPNEHIIHWVCPEGHECEEEVGEIEDVPSWNDIESYKEVNSDKEV